MSMFQPLNISSSALTAGRMKMDIISSNIANATTTRGKLVNGEWIPYRRKMVEVEPSGTAPFSQFLKNEVGANGVKVTRITEDQTPFQPVYDPAHPDANKDGYVMMPNVDITKEMVDLMSASRAYEANVTAFNVGKTISLKALDIGR
ncbi:MULTISPECIES: flagellar basal body rod protein FlgC [Neobacillus]|jgi:flagellar basal-body rod protein FlgC|uniref:flagellar basal body rod protein FlgC n=1 Tax=Neobacillus TaxID=2675232 RepID=UPI000BF69439|nr:flagellar basal body rod protein FlgC [Neobacillus sp. OS1-33]PEQ89554.1 flagellar basal body rod protein FlgC [Bacillus sp. AFS006103]WML24765.1 flagellar basal body rod protein FlgC [Neobacillus sp. OS1-33]